MSGSPRIRFVIGGAQKGGTTALAHWLQAHPGIARPQAKEAHVFDDPAFDEDWGVQDVDARYAPHFGGSFEPEALHGDATPIYMLHPRFVQRIARYNPGMRWVLLLRDPAARAVSQYHMERGRGAEHRSLPAAMLMEHWRLRGHRDDFSPDSPLRRWSYRLRGDYAAQLAVIGAHFPADQVLVVHNDRLAAEPQACYAQVCAHLGLGAPANERVGERVFEGAYRAPDGGFAWLMLRWLMRRELAAYRRLRAGELDRTPS